jgi:uncharacterized membrane protein
MGWHAPAIRRVVIAGAIGLVAASVLAFFVSWPYAVIGGWDTVAVVFLASIWPLIWRASGAMTQQLAMQEDETRTVVLLLLVSASLASLLTVLFALNLARHQQDAAWRFILIGVAVVTVVLSWIVVNTLFTLRYADLHYRFPPGIDFGDADEAPNFRDFAYVAFTIGMTYQVSDTTLRRTPIRRTVLLHALLSYLFGVVIVAASVGLIANLLNER